MTYTFKCRDIGFDEPFEIKDADRDEMMKLIAQHAKHTHNLNEFSPDFKMKIDKAIKVV